VSNVVDALERMGREAQLRHAEGATLALALAHSGLDAPAQAAILSRDVTALRSLLGVQGNAIGLVYAPQDEEEPADAPAEPEQDAALRGGIHT
jgi:hypothetical protein